MLTPGTSLSSCSIDATRPRVSSTAGRGMVMRVKKLSGQSRGWLVSVLILCVVSAASAQTFNSGSDESDGELLLNTPGTYIFDPKDSGLFGRVLDQDGDGI